MRISQKLSCLVFGPLLAVCSMAVLGATAQAETPGPGWEVTSTTYPTDLAPGGTGTIELDVFNVGAEKSNGTVTVTDTLPPGITSANAGSAEGYRIGEDNHRWNCTTGHVVTCINNPVELPSLPVPELHNGFNAEKGGGSVLHIGIAVEVEDSTVPGTLTNDVTVAGGGASAPASTSAPITVSSTPASSFGFQDSDGWFSNANGTVDTQAGSHPYEFTYSFDLNTRFRGQPGSEELGPAGGESRNLTVNLPPGFIGNPTAVPRCSRQEFEEEVCSPSTQVGTDIAQIDALGAPVFPNHFAFAVYNLTPPSGIPAQFAFDLFGNETFLDAGVRSGGNYGITVHVDNLLAKKFIMGNRITFWGEPSDPAHNEQRFSGGSCYRGCASTAPRVPFLTVPTSCSGPQTFSETINTWETAGFGELSYKSHNANGTPVGFTGCDHLGFGPTVSVAPDTTDADTPAGLTVDVRVPQEGLTTTGTLSTSNIKDTTVVLPKGVVINPGQAAGLQACQASEDGLTTQAEKEKGEEDNGPAKCPNASKVGTIEIETPLLFHPLKGDVYVLQSNPPNLQLLVSAEGEGVFLKLIGDVSLCEKTGEEIDGKTCEAAGQLITKFAETPELPFTDFKLSFTGGAQAALATPTECGQYATTSDFTPWSTPEVGDAFPTSNFAIDAGTDGSACPGGTLPFSPSLTAGSTTDQAGGYTHFSMLLQSGDDQQRIEKLQFKAPEGLAGMISQVPLCGEPQAAQGTCPASSQIGHTVIASGPGPYPLVVPQPGQPPAAIYLTGPYEGAPFGLSIVVPVVAGPFTLQTQIVRAKIEIDPHTAQVTVTTNPLPQVIDGVPTDLRSVDAVIDRPGFMFNPTNCEPKAFSGTAWGTPPPGVGGPGTTAAISSPFQMGSCRSLLFKPDFTVSTSGKTSRTDGASLEAKIVYPPVPLEANQASGQANSASVKVELPKQLPARLTTLQKACTAAQFDANPAGCPAASLIGQVKVITPVLPVPLDGPAYFVSNGGEAFPNLIMVLQGDGVTVDLVGDTFISKAGITSSTFKTVPDVPFTSFDLKLPEGPYSALATDGNLCTSKLVMPTTFVGQNGAVIHQNTKIAVTGCPKRKVAGKHAKRKHGKRARRARRGSGRRSELRRRRGA